MRTQQETQEMKQRIVVLARALRAEGTPLLDSSVRVLVATIAALDWVLSDKKLAVLIDELEKVANNIKKRKAAEHN
jgi:hypothetical protein